MHDLEVGYQKIADFRRLWIDRVAAANTEKMTTLKQLQATIEREAKLQEEVSHLTADLQSSKAELESAHQNITSLESRIKSKKHSIHRLRR